MKSLNRVISIAGLAMFVVCLLQAADAGAETPPAKIDFAREIKPILSNNCFFCHGPDADQRKGGSDGLRIDSLEGATVDLGGYAAIVPGQPEMSEIVKRIVSLDPDEVMPPAATGKKLTPREIELLTRWIQQGATYTKHWSYVKPARPAPPVVKNTAWPRNDIDRFLLHRLEQEGLSPAPEADRYALIRRLSLDLTGLPPSIEEADAFAADTGPAAYEKLVDRLLARETYGEHWAHMWLDLARYADSAGYADDKARVIWLYRDYVIRSLNANKPFDQFTVEQVAGDLLANATQEQLIATAFHRNTLTNNEGGTNDEEFRNVAVVDRVNTTLAIWMGTTIACAQCHTHKYDPISQEEFFRVFAILNNTEDADRPDESPLLEIYSPEQQRQRSGWQAEIAELQKTLRMATPDLKSAEAAWRQTFPLDVKWQTLKPTAAKSQAGVALTIKEDGAVQAAATTKNDVYTVEFPLAAQTVRALRLEALPLDTLPGKGPGFAGGNFALTGVSAWLRLPQSAAFPAARFVRIEAPGKQRMLSLAEVQVFRGADNLALQGTASQSSTDYAGDAQRAIDGQTDGRYEQAKSTTHTKQSDDPWWEVELKSEQPIDRIVVWNRTDSGVEDRLRNYRVIALNELREPVWQQVAADYPKPSAEFSAGGQKPVELAAAVADFAAPGFEAEKVLNNKDPKKNGWSIAGQTGRPHALTLLLKSPLEVVEGATLTITLEQGAQQANQTLGHFRLSTSDDARAVEAGRAPLPVAAALAVSEEQRTAEQKNLIEEYYLSMAPALKAPRQKLAGLEKQLADLKPATVPVMRELGAGKQRETRLQHRGNYLDLGKPVTAGTPSAFPSLPEGALPNRLALARWLVDENNPLTARVIANRYWEQLFGIGIVSTSEEFGSQGDQPFHPELLDWLATELVRLKWEMKALVKLLVTSAAYRQSSRVTPALEQRDPENRLLARGPRFRLSAEMVRDQALLAGGLLSPKMYGPPVKPPQPSSGLNAAFGAGIDWQTSDGEDRYRRALYTNWRRSSPYPSMATFDAPNREVCTVRRVRTNTPLQALVTLNDPVYVEAAQALARRLVASSDPDPAARTRLAFRLCLTRPPHDDEVARLQKLFEQSLDRFRKQPEQAALLASDPLGPLPKGADAAELAAWTVVGNVLLNLDETLMKR